MNCSPLRTSSLTSIIFVWIRLIPFLLSFLGTFYCNFMSEALTEGQNLLLGTIGKNLSIYLLDNPLST